MERIRLKELKIFGSVILIVIGSAGLLYSYPFVINADTFGQLIMRRIFYVCLSLIIACLLGLFFFSNQKDNNKLLKINVFVPTIKKWRLSMKFALVSLTLIASLFVFVNPTPGYAPHSFAYNIGFFIPVIFVALIFCAIGLIIYYRIDKKSRKEFKNIYRILVHISLLPYIFMLTMLTINLILMPSY